MAVIKCKMCGGDLSVAEGATVAVCEYCGTKQTVPSADNEKKLTLFSRANRLRLAGEFDKAAGVYENIASEFPTESEAYWGAVLCRYGIEYVDDPATGRKVPTCHRSSFESIFDDEDFEQACENADAVARRVYREEAKAIEEIRKGIIEVSGKEQPYDIFICYKETDESGDRTIDSVIAQEVYDALTEKGYRVFFSRVTLEDKLGTEYEPYIFAALNSARLMLVFGTDYENFNAVWVKNEWSRYLKLMASDKSKRLIPCFKGIDAYDMPKEFQRLQAQDMGKVGAIQDLLRGVAKLLGEGNAPNEGERTAALAAQAVNPTLDSLLKRGNIFMADDDWDKAEEYFNRALDIEPECAAAYVGLLCTTLQLHEFKELAATEGKEVKGDAQKYMQKATRYGTPELRAEIEGVLRAQKAYILEKEEERKIARQKAEEEQQQRLLHLAKVREQIAPASKMLSCQLLFTSAIKTDGTVIARGNDEYGQCRIGDWTDIVSIRAGYYNVVGLKSDGTVVAAGITSTANATFPN